MIDRVGDETSLPGFRLENAKSQPLGWILHGKKMRVNVSRTRTTVEPHDPLEMVMFQFLTSL